MTTPSKPGLSGWYVDLDGKKSGPYNVEQIRDLLMAKRIQAEHRVFAEHEVPKEGEQPGERTSNRLLRVGELLDHYTDPALSLLDALQAARGRTRAVTPGNVHVPTAEERKSPGHSKVPRGKMKDPGRKPSIPPQLAIFVATAMVAIVVVWGTLQLLKHSSSIMPPSQSQVAKGAEGIKAASIGEPTPSVVAPHPGMAGMPGTPGVTAPTAQSVVPVAASGGGVSAHINRPRPFSRPLASVGNQGRPAPPEVSQPAKDGKDDRDDRDAAEERERKEREAHDNQDNGGGGGQPIDSDPGAPAQQRDPNNSDPGGTGGAAPTDPNLNQN